MGVVGDGGIGGLCLQCFRLDIKKEIDTYVKLKT